MYIKAVYDNVRRRYIRHFSSPRATSFSARLRGSSFARFVFLLKRFPNATCCTRSVQSVPLVFQTRVTAEHDCPLRREATTRYRDLATSTGGRCEISGSGDEMEEKKKPPIREPCDEARKK